MKVSVETRLPSKFTMSMTTLRFHLYQEGNLLRLLFLCMGFVPIGSLCIALFGVIPLHLSAKFAVLPMLGFVIWLGLRYPQLGRLALLGFLAGMIATGVYDMVRFTFVWTFALSDPIPVIGRLALMDDAAHPFWGYLWRFVGNGGAMGMAFAMLPWKNARAGMTYGTLICFCLFATLVFAPGAQQMLFPLNLVTAPMALIGHLVYGSVLGYLMYRWDVSKP
jgi:hypothetical protein